MYTIHIIRIGLKSRIYNIPKAAQTYATKTQGSLHVHKKLLKDFFNSLNEVHTRICKIQWHWKSPPISCTIYFQQKIPLIKISSTLWLFCHGIFPLLIQFDTACRKHRCIGRSFIKIIFLLNRTNSQYEIFFTFLSRIKYIKTSGKVKFNCYLLITCASWVSRFWNNLKLDRYSSILVHCTIAAKRAAVFMHNFKTSTKVNSRSGLELR